MGSDEGAVVGLEGAGTTDCTGTLAQGLAASEDGCVPEAFDVPSGEGPGLGASTEVGADSPALGEPSVELGPVELGLGAGLAPTSHASASGAAQATSHTLARDGWSHAVLVQSYSERGSVSVPVMAAAAATAGETR